MDNAPQPPQNTSSATMARVRLDLIAGLHPAITQAVELLSVPPLKQAADTYITAKLLQTILETYPVRLTKHAKRLRCVGNVRLYQLALRYLPQDEEIPCTVVPQITDSQIVSQYLAELLYAPALLGINTSDLKTLFRVAATAAEKSLLPHELTSGITFSTLYSVDGRTIRGSKGRTSSLESTANDPALEERLPGE